MALTLPQLYKLANGWVITPEYALTDNIKPDYLVGRVTTSGLNYGKTTWHAVVGVKPKGKVSWWALTKEQLYSECENDENNGRISCIALIGYEICFFRFDVTQYESPGEWLTGFDPLNLNGWGKQDFDELGMEVIVQTNSRNVDVIRVI